MVQAPAHHPLVARAQYLRRCVATAGHLYFVNLGVFGDMHAPQDLGADQMVARGQCRFDPRLVRRAGLNQVARPPQVHHQTERVLQNLLRVRPVRLP